MLQLFSWLSETLTSAHHQIPLTSDAALKGSERRYAIPILQIVPHEALRRLQTIEARQDGVQECAGVLKVHRMM